MKIYQDEESYKGFVPKKLYNKELPKYICFAERLFHYRRVYNKEKNKIDIFDCDYRPRYETLVYNKHYASLLYINKYDERSRILLYYDFSANDFVGERYYKEERIWRVVQEFTINKEISLEYWERFFTMLTIPDQCNIKEIS